MFLTKVFILLTCCLIITVGIPIDEGFKKDVLAGVTGGSPLIPPPGGETPATAEEIRQFRKELQISIKNLASNSGLYYKISKLIRKTATTQVVSGLITKMKVDLLLRYGKSYVKLRCGVKIWTQPWIPSTETTISCPNQLDVVEKH